MQPVTGADAKRLAEQVKKKLGKTKVLVVVAPPFVHIPVVQSVLRKSLPLSAQDISGSEVGPHTGEISARMLYAYGVRYSIVGHSERRAQGETDVEVNKKIKVLLGASMVPVVCVGERERDHHGKYYSLVEAQLHTALRGVSRNQIAHVVIAYEPVWAISSGDGKGKTATPEHAHEMKLFIQKVLVSLYGRTIGMRVPVLYGGSVHDGNARELATLGEVDGFLVGGASLKPDVFTAIVKAIEKV